MKRFLYYVWLVIQVRRAILEDERIRRSWGR